MIFQLMYHSLADVSLADKDIQDILNTARAFNARHQITGCLLFYERKREFMQILEGKKTVVEQLFESIKDDERHNRVYTIFEGIHTERFYQNWSMAYHSLDEREMSNLEGLLPIEEFKSLKPARGSASVAQRLFYHIAQNIIHNRIA